MKIGFILSLQDNNLSVTIDITQFNSRRTYFLSSTLCCSNIQPFTWSLSSGITCNLPQATIHESKPGNRDHLYNAVAVFQEGNRLSNIYTNSSASLPSSGMSYKNSSTSLARREEKASELGELVTMADRMLKVFNVKKETWKEKGYVAHPAYITVWLAPYSLWWW